MSINIDRPLGEFFKSSDIAKINIPIFQRPYSWTKDQVLQFLSDLDISVKNGSSHFLGLIVYVAHSNQTKSIDVIDGQQRLTTIIITLSTIRDLMEDLNANFAWDEDEESRNNDEINKLRQALMIKQECRLVTLSKEKFENEFIETIQKSIRDFKEKNKSPRKEYEEQGVGIKNRFNIKRDYLLERGDKRITKAKNSYKNYLTIHNHINGTISRIADNESKFEYLIKYSETLLESFRYIPFQVDSYEQAFEYFEVLNDRGLDISALDLIKNECLKKSLTETQRKAVYEIWSDIFSETLDQRYNIIQFIRYSYMRDLGHITKREIYSSYKNILKSLDYGELNDYLTNKLLIRAKIFRDFSAENTELSKPKFHNLIQLLKSTKTVQWYSIVMAALEPLYQAKKISIGTEDKIVKLLENVHELMFSINFVNVVTNNIETVFPNIAKSITYSTEKSFVRTIDEALERVKEIKNSENLSFSNVDISNSQNLVSSFELNNDLGNMIVFLFKYYDKKSSDDKFSIGTLEHLFPQKPKKENWPIIESDTLGDERKKEMIYSLGNFFTTNSTLNPSLGNKSFKEKVKVYKDWNLYDIIPSQSAYHYTNVTNWSFDVVEERTRIISTAFNKRFKVTGNV
jgi:uncharacterized protein with ParB-like and HNH nuclease domain